MHFATQELEAPGDTSRTIRGSELAREASWRYTNQKSSEERSGGRSEDESKEVSPHDSYTKKSIKFSRTTTATRGCEMSYDITLFTAAYMI